MPGISAYSIVTGEKSMDREVIIAGAGISGLTAAINLKRAGRPVRVLERNKASGLQRSPDWDAVENWTSLEDLPLFLDRLGIESSRFEYIGPHSLSVIDPFSRRYDVDVARPLFYMIKRGASEGGLEHGLQAQAQDMGIPIEYGTPCPRDYADIWAGGTLGQGARFISTGMIFKTDHPDWVCGIVDARIAPRAYAYLVVVQGEGTLAVVLTDGRKEANQLLNKAIEVFKHHSTLDIREPRKSGGVGGDLTAFWHSEGDFVIGEAGGFQDFLWGFGIRHAFTSGYLASKAILTGEDWQALARRELRPLVRASLVNRWLYDRMPARGYAALIHHFSRSPDLGALLDRWYHPRPIHRLLWSLASFQFRKEAARPSLPEIYTKRTRRSSPLP
jgi:hypothetical protein